MQIFDSLNIEASISQLEKEFMHRSWSVCRIFLSSKYTTSSHLDFAYHK